MITDLPSSATRLVVAYVASHERDDVVELGFRFVQFSGFYAAVLHQTAASILHRAVDGGWLTIVQHHAGRRGAYLPAGTESA